MKLYRHLWKYMKLYLVFALFLKWYLLADSLTGPVQCILLADNLPRMSFIICMARNLA